MALQTFLLIFTIFLSNFVESSLSMKYIGFTIDVFHRSSLKFQSLHNTTTPDAETNENDPHSDLQYARGQYLMSYGIGVPRYQAAAMIDTGSSFVWLQCEPCIRCYPQYKEFHNPETSLFVEKPLCYDPACLLAAHAVTSIACEDEECFCLYNLEYFDGSHTKGQVYQDKLTLQATDGGNIMFGDFIYGCGRDNQMSTINLWSNGVVGLGRGYTSLIHQIYLHIQGKFAHCLVKRGSMQPGKLMFGTHAMNSGIAIPDVVSTRMVSRPLQEFETEYHATLAAISVGEEQLNINPVREANLLLDVGTTVSRLPSFYLTWLETRLEAHLDLTYQSIDDPGNRFHICYSGIERVEDIDIPPVRYHFNDGGSITFNTENLIGTVATGIHCIILKASPSDEFILGSISSVNFVIAYDLSNERIYFKNKDCSTM